MTGALTAAKPWKVNLYKGRIGPHSLLGCRYFKTREDAEEFVFTVNRSALGKWHTGTVVAGVIEFSNKEGIHWEKEQLRYEITHIIYMRAERNS